MVKLMFVFNPSEMHDFIQIKQYSSPNFRTNNTKFSCGWHGWKV